MNYFSLFAINEQYDIDLASLEQKFKALQRATHPDRFASASESERRMYIQKNAQINDGFHVLKDDVSRGVHLLENRGIDLPGEQETIGDTEFLMQQMELREALAEAQSMHNLLALESSMLEKLSEYKSAISKLLTDNTETSNQQASIELNKLKFIKKLKNEIELRKTQLDTD